MLMKLVQTRPARPEEPDETYEEELHDVNAIIADMCIALGDTGSFEFRIAGFGESPWPLDVTTDLAIVLEQLPAAMASCSRNEPFQLDLYEQGVERRLDFIPSGKIYRVSCNSFSDWIPEPNAEEISIEDLRMMLSGIAKKFCELATGLLPETSKHPWFQEYARTLLGHA
ncbi:MAG: hypothetical protein MJE77_48150 [Proteobacteria bacterium]|nr:hypothetical protein [Pseudomonadota bacterium]